MHKSSTKYNLYYLLVDIHVLPDSADCLSSKLPYLYVEMIDFGTNKNDI